MRYALAAVLLLVVACDSGQNDSSAPPETPPSSEAQAWLDAQNAVRRAAQPAPPTPLPALTWSSAAAEVAQAWANNCTYQHNAGRGTRGENIAANAPPSSLDLAGVVNAWASEAQYFDYSMNTCAAGQQCGHYTQIVWRDTLRVGCAHHTCTSNSPFGAQFPNWEFWVCDYEPPGNYVGQKPY